MHEILPLLESLIREVRAGRPAALCVVVRTKGSTPQVPGACLLLRGDMESEGTLGGGCVEAEVRRRAFACLQRNQSRLLDFVLDHAFGWGDGLICGGSMDIAVASVSSPDHLAAYESACQKLRANLPAQLSLCVQAGEGLVEYRVNIAPVPRLIIAGGGHVGLALAELCRTLEFNITVIDDREQFANTERFGPQVACRVGPIDDLLRSLAPGPDSYVVIVTRGHLHDERALAAVIDSKAKYIGMIGSKRKIEQVYRDLGERGVSQEQLRRVHAPIGLDIKAVTVSEIAVSIAAELIQIHRADYKHVVEGPFPVADEVSHD